MRSITCLCTLVVSLLAGANLSAQSQPPPLPTDTDAGQPPPSAPASQPAGTTAPDVSEAPGTQKPKRENNSFSLGLGPAVVAWPPAGERESVDVAPGFSLHARTVYLAGGIIGFEWTTDVVFQDFETIGNGYKWFFSKDPDEPDSSSAALKIAAWPALLLIPFAGANYQTGIGAVIYTSPRVPSLYLNFGVNVALYLRISDPEFRADFGGGLYGGLGVDITKTIGVSMRTMWGLPLIHQLTGKTSNGIATGIATLNFTL